MDLRKIILARYVLLVAIAIISAVLIIGKIMFIQFAGAPKWAPKLKNLEEQTTVIQGRRGDIFARDGRVLATSVPSYEIRIDMGAPGLKAVFHGEVNNLAHGLSKIFTDKSEAEFRNELMKAYKKQIRYYLVHPRKVNYYELLRIKELPILNRGKYKGGLIVEEANARILPYGKMAYRTIGLLNKEGNDDNLKTSGLTGIEEQYEKYLKGDEGLSLRQNLSGRWVNVTTVEPESGNSVLTTIDIFMQDMVENALRKQLEKSNAEYGTAILMEVATGKIRAISNLGLQNGNYSEIYNYAIGHEGCNEPGSTFKLISMMIALDEGKVDTSDVFDIYDGKMKFYDRTIYDSDYGHGTHGKQTVKQIFERSSNVGVSRIVQENFKGKEKVFIDRICDLGLDEPLDLGIKGEAIPYVKHPKGEDWWGTSLAYMSQGYEIKLSPLQILTVYNAVANDGQMMKPMFVESVIDEGEEIKSYSPKVMKNSICSRSTLRKLRAMLEGVVENGTAKGIKTARYKIAGKTGTAKVSDKEKGYEHSMYRASFAGYFPADDPKYSCIVVIAEPKGDFYGSTVAGPVFKEIADCVFSSLDFAQINKETDKIQLPNVKNGLVNETKKVCRELKIKTSRPESKADWVSAVEGERSVELKSRQLVERQVPNVVGMGVTDAIYLIEKAGMRTQISGVGVVRRQSPSPGVTCKKGQTVVLDLS
jgi:cell division protein FtsI (penicillin-binding protein 3)